MLPTAIFTSVLIAVAAAAPAPATYGPVKLPITRSSGTAEKSGRTNRVNSPATQGDNTGEAPAGWGRDIRYTVPVDIGTPPQQVELQIDTGSSLLWTQDVGSDSIAAENKTDIPAFYYDHRKSSSFKYTTGPDGHKIGTNITYLKGSTTGYIATDVIGVGGQSLPDQGFLSAYSWSEDSEPGKTNVTGILGLGFPRNKTEPDNLMQRLSSGWKDKRFGVYLERATNDSDSIIKILGDDTAKGPGGELTLGGVDESRFTGDIHYVPAVGGNLNFTSHWAVALDGVDVGGKPSSAIPANTPAVLDTGATVIMAPKAAAKAFYDNIPGAAPNMLITLISGFDAYDVPCNTTFGTTFKIGGQAYPIDESDMFFVHNEKGQEYGCIGAVTGGDLDFWLLGDTFLKNVYSVYSVEPKQIGFAKLK